jgi:hypothetical protein
MVMEGAVAGCENKRTHMQNAEPEPDGSANVKAIRTNDDDDISDSDI